MVWLRRLGWLGAAWILALAGSVQAQPRVAVLTGPDGAERPGFVDQLRIQLGGEASVVRGGAVVGSTQSERVQAASAEMSRVDASLGVWLQGPVARSDGDREFVMLVVGRKQDRAVLEVVRLRTGDDDPALDRSLALKLQSILRELPAEGGVIGSGVAPAASEPPAEAPTPQRVHVLIELGALLAGPNGSTGVRPGLHGALGARLDMDAWSVDLAGGVLWLASIDERSAGARVQQSELAPFATLRAGAHVDTVRLGGLLSVQLRIVQAEGSTALGTQGRETVLLTALAAGPELVWSLTQTLSLRAAVPLQLSLRRERFAVNGEVIAETSRFRPSATLALQARWP
jgi:hypothetical protein